MCIRDRDGSEADGSTANTLRARVTDAFGNALAGQAVSVMAGNKMCIRDRLVHRNKHINNRSFHFKFLNPSKYI